MLPNAMPIHSSQVPLHRGYENVVSNTNRLIMDQHPPVRKTACLLSDFLFSAPHIMTHVVVHEVPVISIRAEPPQSHMMCVEALSLIPGLSGQEPQTIQREHTLSSQSVHKDPNKVKDKGAREGLPPNLTGAQPLAWASTGSTPLVHYSLSVNPWMERSGQLSSVGFVRKMSKTSVSQNSPHAKAALMLPTSAPACPLQVPPTLSPMKAAP